MTKLKCPECGSEVSVVKDTVNKGDKIVRYRECENGHKFKTYETYEDYAKTIDNIEWQIKKNRK